MMRRSNERERDQNVEKKQKNCKKEEEIEAYLLK